MNNLITANINKLILNYVMIYGVTRILSCNVICQYTCTQFSKATFIVHLILNINLFDESDKNIISTYPICWNVPRDQTHRAAECPLVEDSGRGGGGGISMGDYKA